MENTEIASSVNFIYDNCPVCERMGRSLACCECMKQNVQGFLILQEGHLHRDRRKRASLMYIPRNLEAKLKCFHELLQEISSFKSKAGRKIETLPVANKLATERKLTRKKTRCQETNLSVCSPKSDINYYQTCNDQIKLIAANQQLELNKNKKILQDLLKATATKQKQISKVLQKKAKLKEYIEAKQDGIKSSIRKDALVKRELLKRKKQHIKMLHQCIFPLQEVKEHHACVSVEGPYETEGSGDMEKSLLQEELDEARRMSFVNGRWVDQQVGSSDVFQISVAVGAASAPSDGNYASYVTWLEDNHNSYASDPVLSGASMTGSTDVCVHQPLQRSVLRISAALGHAAQMTLVIRKILSVHLPHRINYRTFCNPSISPQAFSSAVKLLNCNILSLCLHQGVDGSALHPLHTLRNLQILTEKLLTGDDRENVPLPNNDVLYSMEETLGLTDLSDDDSDDDPDVSDWRYAIESDWQPLFPGEFKPSEPSHLAAYVSTNAQSSLLGQPTGLVTSAFNLMKGWWGQTSE